jgi:hypothetical protein
MGPESPGLLHPAHHRPIPPVQPPLNRSTTRSAQSLTGLPVAEVPGLEMP